MGLCRWTDVSCRGVTLSLQNIATLSFFLFLPLSPAPSILLLPLSICMTTSTHYYTCTLCWLAELILALLIFTWDWLRSHCPLEVWSRRERVQGRNRVHQSCSHNFSIMYYILQFSSARPSHLKNCSNLRPPVDHLSGEPGNEDCGKCSVLRMLTFNFRPSQPCVHSLHTINSVWQVDYNEYQFTGQIQSCLSVRRDVFKAHSKTEQRYAVETQRQCEKMREIHLFHHISPQFLIKLTHMLRQQVWGHIALSL